MDFLLNALNEHYNSARHTIQVVVTWFAFAIPVNLLAGGFAIKELVEKVDKIAPISIWIFEFKSKAWSPAFGLVVLLALVFMAACGFALKGLKSAEDKLDKQRKAIEKIIEIKKYKYDDIPLSEEYLISVPIDLYKKTIEYFRYSTWLIMGLWGVGTLLMGVWISNIK